MKRSATPVVIGGAVKKRLIVAVWQSAIRTLFLHDCEKMLIGSSSHIFFQHAAVVGVRIHKDHLVAQ